MKAHLKQNCPTCGRALPMWRNVFDYDLTREPSKMVVGREPAYRKYKPFCTLRCALAYAREMYDRYGQMFVRRTK